MIPSLNGSEVFSFPYPEPGCRSPKSFKFRCDCCQRVVWSVDYFDNPILVVAGSGKYIGCSRECAHTLFFIHHQYAMKENNAAI